MKEFNDLLYKMFVFILTCSVCDIVIYLSDCIMCEQIMYSWNNGCHVMHLLLPVLMSHNVDFRLAVFLLPCASVKIFCHNYVYFVQLMTIVVSCAVYP